MFPCPRFFFLITTIVALSTLTATRTQAQTPSANAPPPIPSLHIWNVRDFGAAGTGNINDTSAITQAIQTANHAAGGEVVFPPGTYLTGTFEMLSNVTLNLQAGAVLLGSGDVADYGDISAWGFDHNYVTSSSGEGEKVGMIVARDASNFAIVGQGVIDGHSGAFFDFSTPHISHDFDAKFTRNPDAFTAAMHMTESGPVEMKPSGRPGTMIIFSHCKNVIIRDVTLRNAPNWTLHLQSTENAIVSGLRVDNDLRVPNNDGMDCMRCRAVHVSNCNIATGDDDFAFVDSDDVSVANCTLVSNSSGIRLEATRNSTFSDLVIHSNRGIGVYERAAGNTANVLFSNLVIESHLVSGHWWGKGEPILIASAGNAAGGGVHDVVFSNITATGENGILLYGTRPDAIRAIRFDRIKLTLQAPSRKLADAVGGNFDLRWDARDLSEGVFKHGIAALYGHNFQDLRIKDFQVIWKDNLPAYFTSAIDLEDFQYAAIDGFSGRQAVPGSTSAAIVLRRGSEVSVRNSVADAGTGDFLAATAVRSPGMFVNNDLSQAKRAFRAKGYGFYVNGNRLPVPARARRQRRTISPAGSTIKSH